MFSWKEFERNKSIFSHAGNDSYREASGQHHIYLRPKDLVRWIELAKEDLEFLNLVDIVGVDRSLDSVTQDYRFELVYQLLNMGTHQRLNLHVRFDEKETIPSISDFYISARWMEREQREMLKIQFDRNLDDLILPLGQKVYPLRKDTNNFDWPSELPRPLPKLKFNPNKSEAPYVEESFSWRKLDLLSPETLGNFEWLVCFDPEKLVTSEVQIGFHYQGLEKKLEEHDWIQVLQLVDKIQLGIAPTYSMAWAKTIEDLLRIKLPERAQALRIVMLELARIVEHLTVLAEVTLMTGHEEYRLILDAREKVYELFERYCGHRQGTGIVRLGGVKDNLPYGWIVEYQNVSDILQKNLVLVNKALLAKKSFRSHLEGPSVNAQTALQWGITGPNMRASGVNFDLRKSQPFYFYQEIDFDIPVGIRGTSYDRFLIRYEEIFQSLRIVTQVLDNLPLGDYINQLFDKNYFELKDFLEEQQLTHDWHYSSLESPNGEAGFFLLPSKKINPYRIKIKTPSFSIVQALPDFTVGLRDEQLKASIASLGIRRFEIDR